MNILVIAAHPDDEALGCGGSVIRHASKGNRGYLCVLTDGVPGRYRKRLAGERFC